MAEHNRYAAHNHNSKDLMDDLTSKQRTSLKQTNDHFDAQVYVQIRVTGHSLQTRASPHLQSRSKHSFPHRLRTDDHNKPFGNQIDFVDGLSHR